MVGERLTVEDVKIILRCIRKCAKEGDFEAALSAEVDLYKCVLKEISKDKKNVDIPEYADTGHEAAVLATEALKASKIKYTRVTA